MVTTEGMGTCATEVDRGGPLGLDPPQTLLCLFSDCSSGDAGVTGSQGGKARQRLLCQERTGMPRAGQRGC